MSLVELVTLEDLLQDAYSQEINIKIESHYDLGYSVAIMGGYNNCEVLKQYTELKYNEIKAALYLLLQDYDKTVEKGECVI